MTHQPEAEELITHLTNVHGCSEAIRLRTEIGEDVKMRERSVRILPAEGVRMVDITNEVADEIAVRLEEFVRIHDGHHAAEIAARMLEHLRDDDLEPHEHGGGDDAQG